MRNRVRLAIVLTLLAGALCADRADALKPRSEAGLAERIVTRLSGGLGRTMAAVRFVPERRPGVTLCRATVPTVVPTGPVSAVACPCQLPQPPPATV